MAKRREDEDCLKIPVGEGFWTLLQIAPDRAEWVDLVSAFMRRMQPGVVVTTKELLEDVITMVESSSRAAVEILKKSPTARNWWSLHTILRQTLRSPG